MSLTPRGERAAGSGSLDRLFPDGAPITSAPWSQAGKRRDRQDYNPDVVRAALLHPQGHQMVDVDLKTLSATQPSVTRSAVQHYLEHPDYEETGTTYADQNNAGNRRPVLYAREDGTNLLLSGHHRATASLIKGSQFRAIQLEGPWGPPRK
jgi:hypothetical protein